MHLSWQNGVRGLLGGVLLLAATSGAAAQTVLESSNEVRFQFDFKVPDAALAALLPQGFTSNVATQGPAKDCNVRVIFIDRVTINGPDGMPLGKGSNQLVYLTAPVKDATGANAQLVLGGLTADPADAPGPFGNYLLATTHSVKRTVDRPATGAGPMMESQDWVFAAATGEHLEMHLTYERGGANKRPLTDVKFYSAKNPAMALISREELVLDILRNVTTTPADRVKTFSVKAGGGSFAKLFDGTEKVLSWDNILWLNRSLLRP